MFAILSTPRKAITALLVLFSAVWLAACQPTSAPTTTSFQTGGKVQVALLVPSGSENSSDAFLAQNLENSARMAIADLKGVDIDLRIYATAGNPQVAASVATQAVNEGAQIILGPLYAEAANAAGIAVARSGVNVLAFSNNTTIAGGNVFVLGATFQNTAKRLVSYGMRQGINSYAVIYGNDLQGAVGRDAIANEVRNAGATLAATETYAMSQSGIISAGSQIARSIRSSGAQAVFLTGGVNADLPIIATALPEQGISPETVKFIGLTRWDAAPQAMALPGLQGGLFAMPDTAVNAQFEARYAATYGEAPHPLAGLAYDGIAAVGALAALGNGNPVSRAALTQAQGFEGTQGIFRLNADGTNERGLAVATIQNNQVVILEPAPRSFAGAGF